MAQDETLLQLKKALAAIKELRARLDTSEKARTEPIAIIGMGCRFPGGADSPEQFWELLANGVDAITETPLDRWNLDELYDTDPDASGKINSRWGGYLKNVDQFDPYFFGISPKEAALMDPQQRLLLETAWEALEDAGQTREALTRSLTGVYVGLHSHSQDYYLMQVQDADEIDTYTGTGTSHSVVAGRLSYLFDWQGPSVTVDTACSSSLVAIHLACNALRNKECNLALAGGVNIMLSPEFTITASRMHMLSADGRCKPFDQRADGFTRGEGAGVIVLKRLSDAEADGDHILAVIRGSAVNQDGKSNGLTAPNSLSQMAVLRAALANAGVQPNQVSYIEAHGTGTALGDPIEVEALADVLGGENAPAKTWLGSAKSNIGHLEGAAGVAGIIKLVESIRHQAVPPLLHYTALNPHISFENTPFAITTDLQSWQVAEGTKRVGGVSSFGWSGTNAHIVVEEYSAPTVNVEKQADKPVLLPISAHSASALKALAGRYADYLNAVDDTPLTQIGYNAALRRTQHEYRAAVVADNHREAVEQFAKLASGQLDREIGFKDVDAAPRLVMVFSGQGPQWAGMGRELYETQPAFRAALDAVDAVLKPHTNWSVIEELKAETGRSRLDQTEIAQPAIFALQVALAALLRDWGVEPEAVVGHSVGEVAAAHVAGVLSLEDAALVIYHRGRLMQRATGLGKMAAVGLSRPDAEALLKGYEGKLSVAAVNSPASTVLSGEADALEVVLATLQERGVFNRVLGVNYAFHSPQMEAFKGELVAALKGITPRPATIPVYAAVTGKLAASDDFGATYWGRNIREAVLFGPAISAQAAEGYNTWLEISPHPVLVQPILQSVSSSSRVISTLRRDESSTEGVLQAVGTLWTAGYALDWTKVYPRPLPPVSLPSYPWQRSRFWLEERPQKAGWSARGGHPLLGVRLPELAGHPGVHIWENGLDGRAGRHAGDAAGEALYSAIVDAALADVYGENAHQITVLNQHQALDLSAGRLQTLLTEADGSISFQIFSRSADDADWVLNADGQVRVEQVRTDWLYEINWQPQEKTATAEISGEWLVFSRADEVGQAVVDALVGHGVKVTQVKPGEAYAADDGVYTVNPSNPTDYTRLLAEVGKPSRIVYVWGVENAEVDAGDSLSVLYLTQALAQVEWSSNAKLWVVTQGVTPAGDAAAINPGQAQLWGLGRVIALEYPNLWGGLIDLPIQVAAGMAEPLIAEVADNGAEDQIAFGADGLRYVARLERAHYAASTPFEWRADGSYLITGGLRGLGLWLAQWLVEQGAKNLVLTGRSGANAEAQETLNKLEQMGAKITVARADVSQYDELVGVIASIQPPLIGVIHAAGITDDAPILSQNADHFANVMAAKVGGTWNLHQLTKDLALDCFITFSSFASVFGSAGQANYAAANAFMDGLMWARQAEGLPGLSINWGAWAEIGMAAEMSAYFSRMGLQMMNPTQATAALTYLLRAGAVQTVVASLDWAVLPAQYAGTRGRPFVESLTLQVEAAEAPKVDFAALLAETPAENRYDLVLAAVRDEAAWVLGFTPAEALDLRRGFFKMGMDSLMSVQLRNRLENRLGNFLPPTVALEYPTVEALTGYIANEVFKLTQNTAETAPAKADDGAKLDDMSDAELMALLDDELAALDKLTGDDE